MLGSCEDIMMCKKNYDLVNERIDVATKVTKLASQVVLFLTACVRFADVVIDFVAKHSDLINMVFNYLLNRHDNISKSMAS